jgi:hypothetical protein
MKLNMMKNDEKIISEHQWIPWQRYVLFLTIDNNSKKKNNADSQEGFGGQGRGAIEILQGIYPGGF